MELVSLAAGLGRIGGRSKSCLLPLSPGARFPSAPELASLSWHLALRTSTAECNFREESAVAIDRLSLSKQQQINRLLKFN